MKPLHVKVSKFLSFVLRHQPDHIGLTLDEQGWVDVDDLIRCAQSQAPAPLTRQLIEQVVASNDKQRFALSADGQRIRANQGHSVEIDLGLTPTEPPAELFHGTATRYVESIRRAGLVSGARQHVHLSADAQTAVKVGQRHGKPVVLRIDAAAMTQGGALFYFSDNGVWLTAHVPATFITFPDNA